LTPGIELLTLPFGLVPLEFQPNSLAFQHAVLPPW
jgi:hypothetical protein